MDRFEAAWEALGPPGAERFAWVRRPDAEEVVLLLGAFDPPTIAHVELLAAAVRAPGTTGTGGAFCLTKTLLGRDGRALLPPPRRLELLDALAADRGFGVGVAACGTYLGVAKALAADGLRPTFVVGSDKLPQLRDPAWYPDGERGVAQTFAAARFVVVTRPGAPAPAERPAGVEVLDPARVFSDPAHAAISATEVRRRLGEGLPVTDLVPPVVGVALAGYTRTSEPR